MTTKEAYETIAEIDATREQRLATYEPAPIGEEPKRLRVPCRGCGAEFASYVGSDGPEHYCNACEYGLPVDDPLAFEIPGDVWRFIVAHCADAYGANAAALKRHEIRTYPDAIDTSTHRGQTSYSVDVQYSANGWRALFGVQLDGSVSLWQD